MKIANDYCAGCGACSLMCPVRCIEMKENKLGVMEPFVNINKCIQCGMCQKICPQNTNEFFKESEKCYVAWSKKEEDWKLSASGGVATVFARYQLNHGDSFYGCDYDEQINLTHFRIKSDSDIERVRSSKYSQSTAFRCFEQIKSELKQQKKVLFIGTPCQVAGLKSYVGEIDKNLITVDLVCHGTPPTKYLKEHIEWMKFNKPEKIRFRGEYDQKLALWKANNLVYLKDWTDDSYFKAFYGNCISRDACYFCKYAQAERVSDITIADFWGLGELKRINKYSDRPSLVLINNKKGHEFFEKIKEQLLYEEREVLEAIKGNGRLNSPPGKSIGAYVFQKSYRILGFEKAVLLVDKYFKIEKAFLIINNLKKVILKKGKRFIRNRINLIRSILK